MSICNLLEPLSLPKFGIKANVWGARYNLAQTNKIWRLVVPNTREYEVNPRRFASCIDKQSGEDSGFQIRSNSLWTKFVHSQEDRMRDSGDCVRFIMAEVTGLQTQAILWGLGADRKTERYVFDYNSMFDAKGKKLSPVDCVFFPTLSTKKDALPLLKSISVVPGGRDVFAKVIRVAPPSNFYPSQLALAAGFAFFHGQLLRKITGGQLPVLCLKSLFRGKSQGKSGVGRMIMKCVSSWERNKISYRLKMETIKKRLSFTTMPIIFDDVKDDKFLERITEGFDDGEVYETSEGEFVRKAEVIFSANYFGMEEGNSNFDEERVLDRISVIPFSEWEDMAANEFARKQKRFKEVVDDPEKPTEFLMGEIGDFLRSDLFSQKRDEFAAMLYKQSEECIKIRTLGTNYSSFYAVLWKFHEVFHDVWDEVGASWDGFLTWVDTVHAPFLVKQHLEKDHAKHSIRRYILDLLNNMLVWSLVERRKILKICETKKLKNGQLYCLAFHPSPRMDFQEMGGVKIKDLKSHTNGVGGRWGDDSWAALVKDNFVENFNTSEEAVDGLEDTQPKRALLIPLNVFPSSQIMKIANMLGQTEDYKKYGVDEETPSGVEDIRNSTQRTGMSLNLVLSDVSSIVGPTQDTDDNIVFDELRRPEEDNFLEEGTNQESQVTFLHEDVDNETNDEDGENENDDAEDMHFTCMSTTGRNHTNERNPKSTTMKSKQPRNITMVERHDKTMFVCPCGFSSTNKSGSSRHKCRSAQDRVLFACKDCNKICMNPGSLKRHVMTIHKNRHSMSLPVGAGAVDLTATSAPSCSPPAVSLSSTALAEFSTKGCECLVCGKVLANDKNLKNHIEKVHGRAPGTTIPTDARNSTPLEYSVASSLGGSSTKTHECSVCGKVLASARTLKNHTEKMHGHTAAPSYLVPTVSPEEVPAPEPEAAPMTINASASTEPNLVSNPLTCSICGKTLSRRSNVVNHMRNVHGQVDIPVVSALASAAPAPASSAPTSARRRSLSTHKARSSARRR